MLNITATRLAALISGGLLAAVPAGLLSQKAIAAQQLQPNISEGIDENAIAPVYIIDNEAVPVGDFSNRPQAYVSPSDGAINLTLVNTSNSTIAYLLQNSAYRTLQPGQSVTFTNWEIPGQVGIQQFDGGLTEIERIVVSENGESARVELNYAPTFSQSVTGLTFYENGAIYIAS